MRSDFKASPKPSWESLAFIIMVITLCQFNGSSNQQYKRIFDKVSFDANCTNKLGMGKVRTHAGGKQLT